MPSHQNLSKIALRIAGLAAILGLAACQSLGSDAEQRAFVAAHVVKDGGQASSGPIYLAQDGAFARADNDGPHEVAFAGGR